MGSDNFKFSLLSLPTIVTGVGNRNAEHPHGLGVARAHPRLFAAMSGGISPE
jgi:hypothetical protein